MIEQSDHNLISIPFDGRTISVLRDPNYRLWLMLVDVCRALESRNIGRATSRLDNDDLALHIVADGAHRAHLKYRSYGIESSSVMISESGFIDLIQATRKSSALSLEIGGYMLRFQQYV